MTRNEMMWAIIRSLENELSTFDFKYSAEDQMFYREDEDALSMFDIILYNRAAPKTGEKIFLIEPLAWINVKAIEEIYKEITVNKHLIEPSDFLTLGSDLANLERNLDGINRLRDQSLDLLGNDESHVPRICQELLNHFKDFALPYFLKNGNVKAADQLLNAHPYDHCVHMSNDGMRFVKGIIAAKLNNNPALNDLLNIYEVKMKEWTMPEDVFKEMENLKAILPMIGDKMKL